MENSTNGLNNLNTATLLVPQTPRFPVRLGQGRFASTTSLCHRGTPGPGICQIP